MQGVSWWAGEENLIPAVADKPSFIHNICFSHGVEPVMFVSGYVSKMQIITSH